MQSRRIQALKAGKHDFKLKSGSLNGNVGDKRLSKMEKVLIMGLVFYQLVSFNINKSFQVGKWVANHL